MYSNEWKGLDVYILEKPCLGGCVSTGVRIWNAVDYQMNNTEDGVALRGEVCNLPKFTGKSLVKIVYPTKC